MNDTSLKTQKFYFETMMARSGEERFLMGISACQSARRIVLSSLPDHLSETERRVQYFLRLYEQDFTPEKRDNIIARIRRDGESPVQTQGKTESSGEALLLSNKLL